MVSFPTSAQYPEGLFDNHTNTSEMSGLLMATYVHGEDEEREGYTTHKVPHIFTPRRLSTGTYSSLGEPFFSLTCATLETVCSELECMNTEQKRYNSYSSYMFLNDFF